MNKEKFDIDLVKIDRIVIMNATIENNAGITQLVMGNYHFNLSFGFSPAVSKKQSKIRLLFSCKSDTYSKSNERIDVNGKFDIEFYFSVQNLEELLVVGTESNIQIDADLIVSLGNIAYSTSRGIIYTKCQGTLLEKVILPPISNQALVKMLQPTL